MAADCLITLSGIEHDSERAFARAMAGAMVIVDIARELAQIRRILTKVFKRAD